MELTRRKFVDHFQLVLDAQCFWKWPRRLRSVPKWLSGCFYEWIMRSAGTIDATPQQFAELIDPLLKELHATMSKDLDLDPKALTGLIYDRLEAGGVEVRIGQPLRGLSVRNGPDRGFRDDARRKRIIRGSPQLGDEPR
jgi:hypothetical protein